jgi:hypothetical protein
MAAKENRDTGKKIMGRILFVQEERFRIIDEKGRSYLFDLSHRSSIKDQELADWSRAKTWLIVEYEGEPELESGIAVSVRAA